MQKHTKLWTGYYMPMLYSQISSLSEVSSWIGDVRNAMRKLSGLPVDDFTRLDEIERKFVELVASTKRKLGADFSMAATPPGDMGIEFDRIISELTVFVYAIESWKEVNMGDDSQSSHQNDGVITYKNLETDMQTRWIYPLGKRKNGESFHEGDMWRLWELLLRNEGKVIPFVLIEKSLLEKRKDAERSISLGKVQENLIAKLAKVSGKSRLEVQKWFQETSEGLGLGR